MFPAAAQQLYIDAYKQSLAESAKGTNNQLSLEGVAARDAWDAVRRAYVEDAVTHKWGRVGDQSTAEVTHTEKASLIGTLKHLFKH
jgi:cation transport regulator ChaB